MHQSKVQHGKRRSPEKRAGLHPFSPGVVGSDASPADFRTSRRRAFTLIEVMLAIAIMAVICGTIYQFTGTVLRTSSVSMRLDAQEQSFAGLRRLLDAQFAALPTNETRTFIGVTEEGKHGHRDALQIVCPAGNAVLTPDAHGFYRITLGMDETPHGSGHYTLVMEREPWSDNDDEAGNDNANFRLAAVSAGGFKTTTHNQLPSDSVRLLNGVSSLEIAYYDPRLNSWQDKWNDDTMIPSLVRVRLAMDGSSAPYEFVEQIPSGGIRRGLPTTIANTRVLNYPVAGQTGTVPGTNGTVPNLPSGLTVPPPPPLMTLPTLPSGLPVPPQPPTIGPGGPLYFPPGGNAGPR